MAGADVEATEAKVKPVISRPQMRIPAQMVAMAQTVVPVRMASFISSRKEDSGHATNGRRVE